MPTPILPASTPCPTVPGYGICEPKPSSSDKYFVETLVYGAAALIVLTILLFLRRKCASVCSNRMQLFRERNNASEQNALLAQQPSNGIV